MPLRMKEGPECSRLRELFTYCPDTGVLTWKVKKGGRVAGSLAGNTEASGYEVVKIDGATYKVHRVVWAYTYGQWPAVEIDHVDGCKTNNRIGNLREVTREGNAQNLREGRGASQLIGAHWSTQYQKWRAKIVCNGVQKFLGRFDTPEEAHEAYLRAKRELHTTCTI